MEQLAIKKSGNSMNIENGIYFGKGTQCYRCGKRDHVLRDCPAPYTKTLAFAPAKGGSSQPGKPTSSAFIEEEVNVPLELDTLPQDQLLPANDQAAQEPESIQPGNDKEESTWMSNWFHSEFDAYMAWSFIEGPAVVYDASFQESSASKEDSKVIPNAPISDSGASKSVTGIVWLKRWLGICPEDPLPKLSPSSRRFKFGSQRTFDSIGTIILAGSLPDVPVLNESQPEVLRIRVGVIKLDAPCLISRETLFSLNAAIDFSKLSLTLLNNKLPIPLQVTSGGYITFRWIHTDDDSSPGKEPRMSMSVYPSEIAVDSLLTEPEAWKLHVHFGHASVASLLGICRLAHHPVLQSTLGKVVQRCSCLRPTGPDGRPIVNRRIIAFPGQAVVTDTFFPEVADSQRRPAVLFVCDFSKFLVDAFLPNMKPESYVNELLLRWVPLMGFPSVMLCDNATTFG